MKNIKYTIMIIILVSSFVFGQQDNQNSYPPMNKAMGMMNLPYPQMQDGNRMNERMEMMMTWKLTNDLDLTPEQADKFFPRFKEHRDNMDEIDREIYKMTKAIREKIDAGKDVSEKEFKTVLEKFSSFEKQKIDEKERFINTMGDVLSNSQKAKLLMFKQYFMKDLKQEIRKRPSRGT